MVYTDPYTPDRSRYECLDCGHRQSTAGTIGSCPKCQGSVQNLAVPRD